MVRDSFSLWREGGLLLALPPDAISDDAVQAGQSAEDEALLGPSTMIPMDLLEEDEEGVVQSLGLSTPILVADFNDNILDFLREYDPVLDATEVIRPFSEVRPSALPAVENHMDEVLKWAEETSGRANFYSARDEQVEPAPKKAAPAAAKKAGAGGGKRTTTAMLSEQMGVLAAQVASLAESQQNLQKQMAAMDFAKVAHVPSGGGALLGPKLPALSDSLSPPKVLGLGKATMNLGPPPKTKMMSAASASHALGSQLDGQPLSEDFGALEDTSQGPVLAALTRQSAAMTALVAHLASGGDPISDLHGGGSGSLGASTKGLMRRQKLQTDLASQSSTFFLQLHQQMFRKMYPARMVPQKEEDLVAAQVSMCSYLERFGNFKNCRDVGLTLWVLSHAIDASAQGDHKSCQEFLALLALALEQVTVDGDWRIAYHLTLLEEPPAIMFQGRPASISAVGRPFAGLVPQSLAATTLAFIKEVDVLSTKKGELKPKKPGGGQPDQEEEGNHPSPKRKPRFPRKAKGEDTKA